jgi:FdhD protein
MKTGKSSVARNAVELFRVADGVLERRRRRDTLVAEEPLEIRIRSAPGRGETEAEPHSLAVTMRTPGSDFDLVAGFLYSEGIVHRVEQLRSIRYCTRVGSEGAGRFNTVTAELTPGVEVDVGGRERRFYTTSSCGICGKASIEAVLSMPTTPEARTGAGAPERGDGSVSVETLLSLPGILRESQELFERTGGLHAAALFDSGGRLVRVREDVGRHNALDKLVGSALLAGELPLDDRLVLVSGRLGFELVQKAARAGVRILAGVSAPSSLAVQLAESAGITLIGFLRDERFNVYTGNERIEPPSLPLMK